MRPLVAFLFVTAAFTGCFGGGDDAPDPGAADSIPASGALKLDSDGGFTLEIPVHVVLLGFDPGTREALERILTREVAHHAWESYEGFQEWPRVALPYTFIANYTIHEPGQPFTDAFWSFVADETVESDEPDIYDADATEAYLAENLPGVGVPLDANLTTLVVLHDNGALPEDHAWRIAYEYGHLEPVRHFGEKTPIVAHDMSARPDPYVGAAGANLLTPQRALEAEPRPYNVPIPPGGPEALEALEAYVRDATHHRVLQGPAYPVTSRPCHDVSIVVAVDAATLSGKAPGWDPPEAWLDAELLQATFRNLTGDDVRVTVQWLTLPRDDPELSALTRAASFFVPTWDPLYEYLQDNWLRFTDVRPACEGYLSFVYFGDIVGGAHGNGGFAIYDADNQRRISYNVRQDMVRLLDDVDHRASEVRGTDEGLFASARLNSLVSHETGHLFGLLHPQNVRTPNRTSVMNAVESVHSVMSYQPADLTHKFGAVDHITWQRNQAAYTIWRAQLLNLEGTMAFEQAIEAVATYEWNRVQETLEPHVQAAESIVNPEHRTAVVAADRLPERPVEDAFFALDQEVRKAFVEVDP